MPGSGPRRLCVGMVLGPHGVDGRVRLKSFTDDPLALFALGPLTDETGERRYALTPAGRTAKALIARIEGIADRTAAEALEGTRLHVDRAALPEPAEEEYYHADLIGLRVELADGRVLGTVRAVHDFGAGDLIEVQGDGSEVMVPFTAAAVPVVDIAGRRLVVDPPPGLLGGGTDEADGQ